jgi:hypothetical protein
LRYDSGDTQKLPPISALDYEQFMEDNENQLLKELALDEKDLKLTSLVGQRDELVDEEETA